MVLLKYFHDVRGCGFVQSGTAGLMAPPSGQTCSAPSGSEQDGGCSAGCSLQGRSRAPVCHTEERTDYQNVIRPQTHRSHVMSQWPLSQVQPETPSAASSFTNINQLVSETQRAAGCGQKSVDSCCTNSPPSFRWSSTTMWHRQPASRRLVLMSCRRMWWWWNQSWARDHCSPPCSASVRDGWNRWMFLTRRVCETESGLRRWTGCSCVQNEQDWWNWIIKTRKVSTSSPSSSSWSWLVSSVTSELLDVFTWAEKLSDWMGPAVLSGSCGCWSRECGWTLRSCVFWYWSDTGCSCELWSCYRRSDCSSLIVLQSYQRITTAEVIKPDQTCKQLKAWRGRRKLILRNTQSSAGSAEQLTPQSADNQVTTETTMTI